jgi:hypothetical protein
MGGAVQLDISKLRKPTFLDLFDHTGEMHYAVMAIGEKPGDPPQWALEACQAYYFQRQIEVESPGGGRPPRYSVEDGLLLDEVATLMVEEDLAVTSAVKRITEQESDGKDFRRLMRIWKRHLRPTMLNVAGRKPEKTTKWLESARKRKQNQYLNECWDQALAEIKAGNLNIEVDPAEEADRLKRAVWVNFQSAVNPEQDAQLKIAPMSKQRYVVEMKRLLLERMEAGDDKTP